MDDGVLRRILCVEDDPDIQAIIAIALGDLGGFEVVTCSSGPEALERLDAVAPQFVLLDVMMPGMDGVATLAALRTLPAGATVPVAFMTAKAQRHEIDQYRQAGAIGVIVKPFDPIELADQVRALWRETRP